MKKEINKTKRFDIATFETLDFNGNTLLKGGFSAVYDEKLAFGGGIIDVKVNTKSGCGCTLNTVAGCGCVAE